MVLDARQNTKVYLETYILNSSLTMDNDYYVSGATGTADSGTTAITVDAERTEADHFWNNYYIKYGSGPNAGMERQVTHFDSGTDTLTHPTFPNAVSAGETYVLSLTSTQVTFIVCYGNPNYPLLRVFIDKDIDLVFSVGESTSEAINDFNFYPIGYEEHVPITAWCIDKTGITGVELEWKAEEQLRRVTEQYPLGSVRSLERLEDCDLNMEGTIIYGRKFMLNYRRDLT